MSTDTVPFHLLQWPHPELVKPLQENLASLLDEIQTRNAISLERIEGVSIVEDLSKAIRDFDTGYAGNQEAAMRDAVLGRMITTVRNGVVMGHVFINFDVAFQIAKKDAPLRRLCVYTFVHECAHVQDLHTRAQSLSTADLLQLPIAQPIGLALQIAWNEYAASRLSAFSFPEQASDYKALLQQAITALLASRSQVRKVFAPTDEGRQAALTTALSLAVPVLQAFAYLLGHCRGIGADVGANIPETFVKWTAEQSTGDVFTGLEEQLDALWSTREAWPGFAAYDSLVVAICRIIQETTGLKIVPYPGGQMGIGLSKAVYS